MFFWSDKLDIINLIILIVTPTPTKLNTMQVIKVKVTSRSLCNIHQTLPFPLVRIARNAAATIDPTLNLCTRHPLLLGGQRQCGSKLAQGFYIWPASRESNPRPLGLGSHALTARPHAPLHNHTSLATIDYWWDSQEIKPHTSIASITKKTQLNKTAKNHKETAAVAWTWQYLMYYCIRFDSSAVTVAYMYTGTPV